MPAHGKGIPVRASSHFSIIGCTLSSVATNFTLFLVIAITIGQGSMVETFAHMRSPFILSLIRGIDGLVAGTAVMIIVLAGLIILTHITEFFGERYGKE